MKRRYFSSIQKKYCIVYITDDFFEDIFAEKKNLPGYFIYIDGLALWIAHCHISNNYNNRLNN